jgi:hypothetical protein
MAYTADVLRVLAALWWPAWTGLGVLLALYLAGAAGSE